MNRRRFLALAASTALTPIAAQLPMPEVAPIVPEGWTYVPRMEVRYPYFGDFQTADLYAHMIRRYMVCVGDWDKVFGTGGR